MVRRAPDAGARDAARSHRPALPRPHSRSGSDDVLARLGLPARDGRRGDPGWQQYWRELTANDVKLSSGWEEVYNQDFSAAAEHGPRPIVLSYASSPAAEVGDDGKPRTKALLDTCYRQVEYAGVLAGTKDPQGAGQLVDFLLSREFQRQAPEQMYVYPAVDGVPLPPNWSASAPLPPRPAELPASEVELNRDRWVQQWRTLVRG